MDRKCTTVNSLRRKIIQVCYRATPAHPALSLSVNAPILLPSLHLLSSVAVADVRYWNTKFLPGENDNWPDLRLLLSRGGHMRVKRREGSGWLTKAGGLMTPWSLGKAQQEKLTGLGMGTDQMSCPNLLLLQATGKHTASSCSKTAPLRGSLHFSVFCPGIKYAEIVIYWFYCCIFPHYFYPQLPSKLLSRACASLDLSLGPDQT